MDSPPATTLGVEPARPGIMDAPPRRPEARILTGQHLAVLLFYGLIMAVGTLVLFVHARPQGEAYALTLAFATFVLFQFFNIFNARAEQGSGFLRNRWLWLALAGVLGLQAVVVHSGPAQAVCDTVDLAFADWLLAAAVASSMLWPGELRKLGLRLYCGRRRWSRPVHFMGTERRRGRQVQPVQRRPIGEPLAETRVYSMGAAYHQAAPTDFDLYRRFPA